MVTHQAVVLDADGCLVAAEALLPPPSTTPPPTTSTLAPTNNIRSGIRFPSPHRYFTWRACLTVGNYYN